MSATSRGLIVLVRLRLRLFLRRSITGYTRRAQFTGPLRLFLSGIASLCVVGAMVAGLTVLLHLVVLGPQGMQAFTRVVTWGLSIACIFIFFYAILATLAVFTYSSDLELLLLTPLSPRLILADKFFTVAGGFFLLSLFIGMPLLIALGRTLGLGLQYDVAAVTALFLTPFAPVSVAMMFTLAILKWIPPTRARAVVVSIGAAALGVSYILSRLFRGYFAHMPSSLSQLSGFWALVPVTWPGHFLAAVAGGDQARALLYLQGTLFSTTVLSWTAIRLCSHMFAVGWAGYQEVGRRGRVTGAISAETLSQTQQLRAARPESNRPDWLPIVRKEWLIFRRDPQLVGQLAFPLIVALFSLYRGFLGSVRPPGRVLGATWSTAGLYCAVLAVTTVCLLSYLSLSIVNRERRALAILALSPLSARQILVAKWLFCSAPAFAFIEAMVLAGAIRLRFTAPEFAGSIVVLGLLVIALAGLLITFGFWWPRLHADSARQPISFSAFLIGGGASLLVSALVVAALIFSYTHWYDLPGPSLAVILLASGFLAAIGGTVLATSPALLRSVLFSDAKSR